MKKYPLTLLAANLDKVLGTKVGMQGLKILLYGWRMKYHLIQESTFHLRKIASGEAYLTPLEAQSFYVYCGYALTLD